MIVVIGALFVLAGAVFVYLGLQERAEPDESDPETYLRSLEWHEDEADEFQLLLAEPFITRVLRPIASRVMGTASGILPGNYRDSVHERLIYAGLTGQYRAEEVITGQVLLGALGFILAFLAFVTGSVSSNIGVVLLVGLPVVGAQLPLTLLRRKVDERQGEIRRDLPDTLDLLAISVEAGVGFEGALEVVSDNFDSPLAGEFSRTLREMELGLPRRQALENLNRRTEVPELSNFILTLTQADALGMPIGRVLKTQATEMRLKRRALGAGEGGQAAGQDPVPPDADPAGNVHRRPRPGRGLDRRRVRLTAGASAGDRVDAFRQPILIIRWGTATVGLVLAAPDIVDRDFTLAIWTAVVIVYTIFRTIRPIPQTASLRRPIELVLGAGLMAIAASSTGYFLSPLAFSTLTAVAVAGFSSGFAASIRLAIATAIAVGAPMLIESGDRTDHFQTTVQWTVELVLVGIVTGYARRISGEADERHSEALDRVRRLVDANQLLFNLHQIAQDLPASLDLDEVLESTMGRLRELLDFESAAIVLREETDQSWHVARRFGAKIPSLLAEHELPPPIRSAAEADVVVTAPNLLRHGGPGLFPRSESGVYVALLARGALVGVIAVEHSEAFHFSTRDADLLDGFSEAAALAVDNARWFARLRTVGADEERTRIARDLHDRIGQSLAYLAFELDRIVKKDERHDPISEDLSGLREDVRGVVREVRDTLYDLRTDVSDDKDVESVLREFAARIEERADIAVSLRIDQSARMPRLQERELWRIAQEAMINAERHSDGSHIDVFWYSDGDEAIAEVRDDGKGMPLGRVGRLDSYGMLGMRERASSIGAALSVDSIPGRGVTVRVSVRNP